jgi:tRNA pseudouridine38-40 synthase
VQDTLELALTSMAGEKVRLICAGRTDTGVHATGQVVHFDTVATRPESAWVKGVNTMLPESIAILWAKQVREDFHARFCALTRRYSYILSNRAVRPAIGAGTVGWFPLPLDIEVMREAAAFLVGRHDFSAFRSVQCQAKSPVRDLRRIEIESRGDFIRFSLEANAFLHHMVRNIVGCLVYIGKGRYPPDWLADILAARERSKAAPTFPPDGLYLTGVDYASEWALPPAPPINARPMLGD